MLQNSSLSSELSPWELNHFVLKSPVSSQLDSLFDGEEHSKDTSPSSKTCKLFFCGAKSSRSKDDLHEKNPDSLKTEKPKNKSKLLGLFRSASDDELHGESKKRRSFLRRKKTPTKERHHDGANGIAEVPTEAALGESVPEKSLSNNLHPDNALPVNTLPDDALPVNTLPGDALPDNLLPEKLYNNNLLPHSPEPFEEQFPQHEQVELEGRIIPENEDELNEISENELQLQTFDSPPTVLPHPVPVEPAISNALPDDKTWTRAKEVWEKNSTEETKEERKKRKEKEHSERTRERDGRKDEKGRSHRSKEKEHGAGRSGSKSRSKERKKGEKEHKHHEKHKRTEHRHDETREKDDKTKHKSKGDKHSRKHDGDQDQEIKHGVDEDETREKRHKHKHKHSEKHYRNKDETHTHRHDEKHKTTDEKHSRKHSDKHHKHTPEHSKKHSDPNDEKRIELDQIWREYETGKRYHSAEKDMKKIIDRLDGVEKYRREERQRSTDRSRGFSSDTSNEAGHRSRSKERRRRSRSREKHKHESDQECHSPSWQFSLGRIEARQEQCKADIDTARRSIEHRIKQLEARLDKQYSSSERLPEQSPEKSETGERKEFRNIIDKVADECREVTRTLEVRTEAMKSEIASVVREEFENLDERLSARDRCSGSPTSFYRMQLLDNFQCDDDITREFETNPLKPTKSTMVANLRSVDLLSSADESMITVIEENSRTALCPPQDAPDQSQSLSTSRDSPVRISQSGALDTQQTTSPVTGVPEDPNASAPDQGSPPEHPDSPLQARSQVHENLNELSLDNLAAEEFPEQYEDPVATGTQESQQMMYRRFIRETEKRCQDRAMAEKDILYKRINELESMLLSAKSSKENYV